MKILHTKATAEPILLVSTCHNMNLFAIVTRSTLTVYRSTTLTVVLSMSLAVMDGASSSGEKGNNEPSTSIGPSLPISSGAPSATIAGSHTAVEDTWMQTSWSPTGRLFTLALSTGTVVLLDVEGGDLIRRFIPHDAASSETNKDASSSSSLSAAQGLPSLLGAAGDDSEKTDGGRRVLRSPPELRLSTSTGPVVALTWATVAPSQRMQDTFQKSCLPLPASISTPVLEEASQQQDGAAQCTTVSLLMVLDHGGCLSLLVGGIQEVRSVQLQLPCSLHPSTGIRVKQSIVVPYATAAPEQNSMPYSLSFWGLSARSVAALRGDAKPFEEHRYHRCFLVLAQGHSTSTNTSSHQACTDSILEIDLYDLVARTATPHAVAVCSVAEHARVAQACQDRAFQRWRALLHDTIRPELELPRRARLLRDTIVEELTQPDQEELLTYYSIINREALVEALEKLTELLYGIARDVFQICYRCYDTAIHIAKTQSYPPCTITTHCFNGDSSLSTPSDSSGERLATMLGRQRRNCTLLLKRLQMEGESEGELIRWVLQRASLLVPNAPPRSSSDARHNHHHSRSNDNSVVDANTMLTTSFASEPLSAAQQPSLLRSIHRILKGESTAWIPPEYDACNSSSIPEPSATAPSRTDILSGQLENLLQETLNTTIVPPGHLHCVLRSLPGVKACQSSCCIDMAALPAADETDEDEEQEDEEEEEEGATAMAIMAPGAAQLPIPFAYTLLLQNAGDGDGDNPLLVSCPLAKSAVSSADPVPLLFHGLEGDADAKKVVWYGFLDAGRHVVLLSTAGGADSSAGPGLGAFTMAIFDDDGDILAGGDDDEEEEEAEQGEREKKNGDQDDVDDDDAQTSSRRAMAEVKGVDVSRPLLASMSRSREFCVVVAGNKFVVFDLYDS